MYTYVCVIILLLLFIDTALRIPLHPRAKQYHDANISDAEDKKRESNSKERRRKIEKGDEIWEKGDQQVTASHLFRIHSTMNTWSRLQTDTMKTTKFEIQKPKSDRITRVVSEKSPFFSQISYRVLNTQIDE